MEIRRKNENNYLESLAINGIYVPFVHCLKNRDIYIGERHLE